MSIHDHEIDARIEEVVKYAWTTYPATGITRPAVADRLPSILQFDPAAFIVRLGKTQDRRDALLLLLSAPELWGEMSLGQWSEVMVQLGPRPKRTFADQSGEFLDVAFLMRYLRLDVVALALSLKPRLSDGDLVNILTYCRGEAELLFLTSEELSELDGVSFCSLFDLDSARERLMRDCEMLCPEYSDAETFRVYVALKLAEVQKGTSEGL